MDNTTIVRQIFEKIGENLHLLLFYFLGIILSFRVRIREQRLAYFTMVGFVLLIFALIANSVRQVFREIFILPTMGANQASVVKLLIFNILGAFHFFSEIVAWILFLIALKKLFKNSETGV